MEYYTIQQGKIAIPGRGNICEWQKLRCKVSINNWKKLTKIKKYLKNMKIRSTAIQNRFADCEPDPDPFSV
jgi:hypothetical protein